MRNQERLGNNSLDLCNCSSICLRTLSYYFLFPEYYFFSYTPLTMDFVCLPISSKLNAYPLFTKLGCVGDIYKYLFL